MNENNNLFDDDLFDDDSFDDLINEYDNNKDYDYEDTNISEYNKLEDFIINEIYNSISIKKYEDMLYKELDNESNNILDIQPDNILNYLDELNYILDKNFKEKKNEIFKEIYILIKNSINKFNKLNNYENIDNKYIIIPIVNNYKYYIGINCYITNNINEIENIIDLILNLFKIVNMNTNNYELKEINELGISKSILNKDKKLEVITNEKDENIKIFILDI